MFELLKLCELGVNQSSRHRTQGDHFFEAFEAFFVVEDVHGSDLCHCNFEILIPKLIPSDDIGQILFEIVMLVGMLDSLNNVSYRLTQLTMAMNQSIYDTMLVKPKCISENLFIISVVCLQFKENYLFVKAFWLYLLWVRNALAIYNLSFLF